MAFHYYFIKYHFNFVVVVVVVIIIFDSGIYYGSVSVDFFGSHRARGVVERHSRLYLSEEERKNRASLLFNMYASDNEHRVIRHPIFGHQRSSNDNKI